MNDPKAHPSSNSEGLTVIAVAVLLTVVLLLVALRRSNESGQPQPIDFTTKDTFELLQQRKTDAACYELLQRDNVSLTVLRDCLLQLAKSQRTTDLRVLLQWIQAWPEITPRSSQLNAAHVLSDMTAGQRQHARQRMAGWPTDKLSTAARQIVAATEVGDDSGRIDLLSAASEHDQFQRHLILLPLIPSIDVQESYYDDVQHLLVQSTAEHRALDDETQQLLIQTVGRMRGRDTDRAHDLIDLIVSKRHSTAAIESLNRISVESWPEEKLGHLAAAVIALVADTDDRGQRDSAFKLAEKIVMRLPAEKQGRFSDRMAELRAN